ncbi:MAG: alpha/beta hydrolase [Candidatus Levyibacteriota bacterium]
MIFMLFLVCLLLGVFLYTWYRLRNGIYVHTPENTERIKEYKLPVEEKTFTTRDGLTISSWYIPVKNPKAVVILIHGYVEKNGGRGLMLPHADYLYKNGYTTLLINLRTNGKSDGKKVTFGINEWKDVDAAYDFVKSLPKCKGRKIGFMGVSMGGSVAIITAGETGKGDFVIASVPFASLGTMLSYQIKKEKKFVPLFLPLISIASFLEFGMKRKTSSPIALVKNIHVPLLLIGGKYDNDVNPYDAKQLFDKANKPKYLWEADAGHDVFRIHPEEFKKRVLSFLNTI